MNVSVDRVSVARLAPPRIEDLGRRAFLCEGVIALSCLALAGASKHAAAAASPYPETISVLRETASAEMLFYHRYVEFGRRAKEEGYRGIAYLFTAFATSELIHAQNFNRILARLDAEISLPAKPALHVAGTRENLLTAVNTELESIDAFYPSVLERLKPEGLQDAVAATTQAWRSEQQHRDIMKSIQRWSGSHFETVARTIDERTGQYFVCQICGATETEVPRGKCSICGLPSEHFRKIEFPS